MWKQRLLGIAGISVAIVSALATKDLTASIFILPFAVYATFTKEKWPDDNE